MPPVNYFFNSWLLLKTVEYHAAEHKKDQSEHEHLFSFSTNAQFTFLSITTSKIIIIFRIFNSFINTHFITVEYKL